jgi:hypothetical protein
MRGDKNMSPEGATAPVASYHVHIAPGSVAVDYDHFHMNQGIVPLSTHPDLDGEIWYAYPITSFLHEYGLYVTVRQGVQFDPIELLIKSGWVPSSLTVSEIKGDQVVQLEPPAYVIAEWIWKVRELEVQVELIADVRWTNNPR